MNSLSTFSNKSDSSNVLNILNQLASSLIAQNLTSRIRINTPEFTFIAIPPPLQNASTSYSVSEDVQITFPPIKGTSIGAISVVAWGNDSFQATNSSATSSPVLSISFTDSSGAPLHITNLSPPLLLQNSIKEPSPIPNTTFVPECVFWNTTTLEWSSDGCFVNSKTSTTIECACTHLTDFASRFQAIAETNKKVFENAGAVFSLDGLRKYANYYIFVGTFFATLLTIFIYVTKINNQNTIKYAKTLAKFSEITILQHFYRGPFLIDRYYPSIKLHPKEAPETNFVDPYKGLSWIGKLCWIWYNRIFYEHVHLSFFFKFDPRISRQLRALFVFIAILNTLFVSCLLYGYSHSPTGEPMTVAESVVLSLLTSVINIPLVMGFRSLLTYVGFHEYKWRYPYIYDELKTRHIFEEICSKKSVDELWSLIIPRRNLLKTFIKYELEYNGDKFKKLWRFAMTKRKLSEISSTLPEEFYSKIVDCRLSYDSYTTWHKYLPVHTWVGWAGLGVGVAYLIWCLNYILLFGAAQSGSDAVFYNFMSSEFTAVLFSQPLSLFLAPIIGYVSSKAIKLCSKKGVSSEELHSYSDIYVFSDPLASIASTSLSISFGYWLFLRGIIEANTKKSDRATLEIACAPPKAIVASLEEDEEKAKDDSKKEHSESEKELCITVLYYLLRLEKLSIL